ncbi:MAG: DegT/DnrJ/EryC1/StrS aminotransferase family protein [Desulfovibrio sp.]|jgi:perosamine synthetase|nr:DegT/DnrJ/EryC1/StrS aminotransferase family protein [Desulfovibrio sp.]
MTPPYIIALNEPSVTEREIAYSAETLASGRGMQSAVPSFRRAMARCVGREYALAVSGGRAAYYLALRAMGAGPGDEVPISEGADFAAAAAVLHCGATPVFCDLDPVTFTLDPACAAARTGPRTRCIIAAHMYGLPCDMQALEELAGKSGLFLIEDASSGFGGLRQGRAVGSFGDISVFNFKDMSLVHTGAGGMLLSSSRVLAGRAACLGGQGRSALNPAGYDAAGHDFAMSGLAAAVGSARLERLKELAERKECIFRRYRERLGDMPGLRLNPEIAGTRNSFLMPFIVLEQGGARDLAQKLWARGITARPALTPLSSMPLFKKADNPVAHGLADRLLLLPGGFDLTDDEADYVAACVTTLLRDRGLKSARPALSGRLKEQAGLPDFFARIKKEGCDLPFTHDGRNWALSLITLNQANDPQIVSFMGELRRANAHMLMYSPADPEEELRRLVDFYRSRAGTAFLLFLIREEDGAPPCSGTAETASPESFPVRGEGGGTLWGHIGLSSLDYKKAEGTLDALVMRGGAPKGLMGAACETFYVWCRERLKLTRIFAHIRGDNTMPLLLALAAGYKVLHKQSMRAYPVPGGEAMRPMYAPGRERADSYMYITAREL